MDVVTPTTIAELRSELEIDPSDPASGECPPTVAYRGCSDATWDLVPSVARLAGDIPATESAMILEFKKYGVRLLDGVAYDRDWDWWAFGQHHGLPTRFLDWSHNTDTALHFATSDVSRHGEDGVIWVVNYASVHAHLPAELQDALVANGAPVFSVEILSTVIENLSEFDDMAPPGVRYALFFEPPSFDDRITQQAALFSVMSSPQSSIEDMTPGIDDCVRKVIVRSALKPDIRKWLDRNRLTEWRFFPGPEGLAAWLKRRFEDFPGTP
jgi:hypothetical protein